MALLEVRGLRAGYGRTEVLRGVDLTVPEGSTVVLLGPNGAGKSTLLKTISGLLPVTAGDIRFRGEPIGRVSAHGRARRGVCLIPEGRGIFRRLTVRENLVVQADAGGLNDAADRAAALFPVLADRLDQQAGTLSGGQQQMLALARALLSRPRLLLIDEPSLGLAPMVARDIIALIGRLRAEWSLAVLLVEQNARLALDVADRAYVLQSGRVIASGSASELRQGDLLRSSYLGL